ncbi:MAG: prolipoprotein diacylglyceryl transferase [Chitinivibrionales bacterium]
MHPVLFEIGGLSIHSYGVLLAASFLLGLMLSAWRAKQRGLNPDVVYDLGFWLILSAIVGARLYYVFLHFEEFKGNLISIINPFAGETIGIGGLVMLGGLIGGVAAGVIYFRVKKLSFLDYADAIAPALGFGIFLTRIGCFLNGCCYGKPSDSSLACRFTPESPAGEYQACKEVETLFPSQLVLAAGGLLIGLIILFAVRKRVFAGFEFFLAILLYSVLRFSVDYTRFYSPDEFVGPFTHNQLISLVIFFIAGGLLLRGFMPEDDLETTPQEPECDKGDKKASESKGSESADAGDSKVSDKGGDPENKKETEGSEDQNKDQG